MKIVQFKVGSFGGAETFFFKTIAAFNDIGIDQHIIHNEHPRMREGALATGLPHTEIPFPKKALVLGSRLKLRQTVLREKPDLLFCWANRAGRRAFQSRQFPNLARLGGFYKAKFYKSCHHLVCNTPAIVDHMVGQGWDRKHVSMISNFGELPATPPADRADLNVPDDAFMMLSLGRFDEWKGFQDAIQALKHLPENVYYCIAGDGDNRENWEKLADEIGVADRVRFLGWRTDQAALLGAADLCVVPSRHEPLSNVTIEAWSLGVPVLAARSEGPSWLIDSGHTGMLVDIADPDAIAASVREMLADQSALDAIGKNGREKWQGNFSKQEICQQYVNLFEDLIRNNHKRRLFSARIERG